MSQTNLCVGPLIFLQQEIFVFKIFCFSGNFFIYEKKEVRKLIRIFMFKRLLKEYHWKWVSKELKKIFFNIFKTHKSALEYFWFISVQCVFLRERKRNWNMPNLLLLLHSVMNLFLDTRQLEGKMLSMSRPRRCFHTTIQAFSNPK